MEDDYSSSQIRLLHYSQNSFFNRITVDVLTPSILAIFLTGQPFLSNLITPAYCSCFCSFDLRQPVFLPSLPPLRLQSSRPLLRRNLLKTKLLNIPLLNIPYRLYNIFELTIASVSSLHYYRTFDENETLSIIARLSVNYKNKKEEYSLELSSFVSSCA